MNRPRVLVVEDHPNILKLMTTVLASSYEVTTASSGSAALSLVGATAFDVVLTDVRMPGASGFEVLRTVRDRARCTRVVMITAYANVADAVAAIRLGAYDYVAKPLDASEICLVVARAMAHLNDGEEPGVSAIPLPNRPDPRDDVDNVALGFHRAIEEARRSASRNYLVRLMQRHNGNVTQAANQAGMTRESLHRVLKQYGVRSEDHKEPPVDVAAARRAVR